MTKTTNTTIKRRLPNTTVAKAVKKAVNDYIIDTKTGKVYNKNGREIGGSTYEPRITVHLDGKKYNPRINKLIGYLTFGPEALHSGVQIRHKDGDRFNNADTNLVMVRTR